MNDGRRGLTIDWRGRTPVYTHYRIADGKREQIGRESIGRDGGLRKEGVTSP